MAEGRLTICNTSPLINLATIGRVDLLESLFGKVIIPPAVMNELFAKRSMFPSAALAARKHPFQVMSPSNSLLVRGFEAIVHAGEAECLALAMEHPGSMLLLDDLAARGSAEANDLRFTGTLGCLVEAKSRNLIDAVGPLLVELRHSARFWISSRLEEHVLSAVGET